VTIGPHGFGGISWSLPVSLVEALSSKGVEPFS
jgi:hypothetical protein